MLSAKGWPRSTTFRPVTEDRVSSIVGELPGLPPIHKQVAYSGINIFRLADGKIAENGLYPERLV